MFKSIKWFLGLGFEEPNPTLSMELSFKINGIDYKVDGKSVAADTSLNSFIRNNANLRGTKFMCLEGGCGACIVVLNGIHPVTRTTATWSVNSCLFPLFSCQGLDVTTIEGIGNKKDGYHPVQSRLAHLNGTQCGYCSPGMVMNMYSLLEAKNGEISMAEIENSFGGNMCRCTGYRPILDAFKSLAFDADEKLKTLCKDIEDLPTKNCPKTGTPCAGRCHSVENNPLHITFSDAKTWYKLYKTEDIFKVFEKSENRPYMLVAGNTGHGVFRRSPDLEIFIDVNGIEELRTHSIGNVLELGGNVNLTEMMDILTKTAEQKSEFEYCRQLVKHIDIVANVPVRNAGTIAGNLRMKNSHIDFPSDIFLILETVDAKVTIAEAPEKSKTISMVDFLKEDMRKKIITKITLPPLATGKFFLRTYKIMPRAQNAHAYVNAGFLFEFNNAKDKVVSARICFGGINPEFIHATNTEKVLINKDLFKNDVLENVFSTLNNELQPDVNLPDASPEYRKNLALGLLYKAILSLCPNEKVRSSFKSGGSLIERPLSSGTQNFDTYEKNYPLTQPVMKLEALIQCSGEAQYMNDLPSMTGELWAAFVLATETNVRIVQIDASGALKMPGVRGFFTAKDIPGKNNFTPTNVLFMVEEEEIFCSGQVRFHGQPVGVIVAETFTQVHEAAKAVNIDYEKINQKFLPTFSDVMEQKAMERIIETGHYEGSKKGQNANHQISGNFEVGPQYHYSMETQTCVCVPTENGIDVHSATQWMDIIQIAIAECLKITENSINMQVRRLGGAFGAKISRSGQIACAAALACRLLNRPIRFVMSLEQNMTVVGKRYSCYSNYKVEVDDNGKIHSLKNEFVEDMGISINEDVSSYSAEAFKNVYDNSSWEIKSRVVRTDAPSNTWCRSPGSVEGTAMIENIMEHIARETGKEPADVRLSNIPEGSPMRKYLQDFIKSTEYEYRKKDINSFNTNNRWKKRGISIVPMHYLLEYYGTFAALVSVFHGDGTVSITHGGIEMGQGINTKVAQVAAHVLGIPLNLIAVKPSNVLTAPNSTVSGGSIASDSVAFAVMKACQNLMERLAPVKNTMPHASWSELIHACFLKKIDLCSTYLFKESELEGYGIWGLTCCEIELDILTGNLQLRRVDILEDTGESMSPNVDVGQVEGAFVMGIGYWLHESLVYNRQNGELLTNRTWNYKPPGVKDIPVDFRITFLQKSSNPKGVLRSKATGEPPLVMSVVVIFALRHALDSARKDAGLTNEWYNMGAPSTAEQIFLLAGNKLENFQL